MIFRLLILCSLLLGNLLAEKFLSIPIENGFERFQADEYLSVFIEKLPRLTSEQVFQNREKLFHGDVQVSYPPSDGSVWTWVSFVNHGTESKSAVLENPFCILEKMDVYVYKEARLSDHFGLGMSQKKGVRYSANFFRLSVEPGERADVLIRYQSDRFMIKSGLFIYAPSERFMEFMVDSQRLYALVFGVLIALIVYHLYTFMAIKDRAFLLYALYGLFMSFTLAATNGILNELGLCGDLLMLLFNGAFTASIVLFFLLTSALFDLKKNAPRLFLLNLGFIFLYTLLGVTHFVIFFFPELFDPDFVRFLYRDITNTQDTILRSVYAISLASYVLYRGWLGSSYFLIGLLVYLGCSNLYVAYMFAGIFPRNFWLDHAFALGILGDMVFISAALSRRLYRLERERIENRTLLYERSRFTSIGNVLAGVLHQLKTPLNYVGSLITYLEAKGYARDTLEEEDKKLFSRLKEVTREMNGVVLNVHNFYSVERKAVPFSPKEMLTYVLELFSVQIVTREVSIQNECDNTPECIGFPNTLAQVVTIILENALQIMQERQTPHPQITLVCESQGGWLSILISDNGGGIHPRDIPKVFDLHFSNKKEGAGIGLALAKELVENTMKGEISAKNGPSGAIFCISFPSRVA